MLCLEQELTVNYNKWADALRLIIKLEIIKQYVVTTTQIDR